MRPKTDDLSPAELQVLEDIEQHGVHVISVPSSDGVPGLLYTVGLWHRFGQPEVLVVGLDEEVAGHLLGLVADEVSEDRNFDAGDEAEDLLERFPARFVDVKVDVLDKLLPVAVWAYETEPFPVVQLVYPDEQGRWPWQDDADVGFKNMQPLFGDWLGGE